MLTSTGGESILGVLVMAHGTPSSPEEIARFYTSIRRGRRPSPELLADLNRRYQAIGGTSPLADITASQVHVLQEALGPEVPVAIGNRFTYPSIEDALGYLRDQGVVRVAGAVLSPQYSSATTERYFERARLACAKSSPPLDLTLVESWHLDSTLIGFLASEVSQCLGVDPEAQVVFTAHSLPISALTNGDPYPSQVDGTARAVAEAAGLSPGRWSQAWQSAGRTAEEWIGPDIADTLRDLAKDGAGSVVVCPVGFSADNLESLYDLDIEAAGVAAELGLAFRRTALPNADPLVMASLAKRLMASHAEP